MKNKKKSITTRNSKMKIKWFEIEERHENIDSYDTEVTVIGVDENGVEYTTGAME